MQNRLPGMVSLWHGSDFQKTLPVCRFVHGTSFEAQHFLREARGIEFIAVLSRFCKMLCLTAKSSIVHTPVQIFFCC